MNNIKTMLVTLLLLSNCAVTSVAKASMPEPLETALYGYVNDEMLGRFVSDVVRLQPSTPFVLVHINSVGGEVRAGYVITKLIEEIPVPVVCMVDMEASSMAFYILQACDVRMMTRRSHLMIHAPYSASEQSENAVERKAAYNDLRAIRYGFAEHISMRLGITAEEYLAKLGEEIDWTFNWKEALSFNAVDIVVRTTREGRELIFKTFEAALSSPEAEQKAQ